ncbi:MAG: Gfo/Idh/MocA family oxidoreductase [Terracidiphilus sp.]
MIRVGLVGFGMAGRVFHGPLISSVDGLELAAVVERNSSNAPSINNAAQRYPGITTYRTLDDLLADASLDLFVVATPSGTHFQVARQILEAGKNVVVDKPLSTTTPEIAQLIKLAAARKVHLIPFFNRRWDSDFQTIQKLLHEGPLGHLVYLESRFDRWRPNPPSDRLWKEDPTLGGGVLLDLGTHIADQALTLFGKPESIAADVLCERDWARVNDAFTLRLRYPNLTVVLGANCLSSPPRPRFHLRGTKGNYIKSGLDPQEAALNKVTRVEDPQWGHEPAADWGTLHVDVDGSMVTRPVSPIPGDYRHYYAAVRDTILGKATAPIAPVEAWRVARLLEWAEESSDQRREIECDWSEEPD